MGQCTSSTQVQPGDGCWALYTRCGITEAQFKEYNGANICSNLQVNQMVCCSPGNPPVPGPPQNADGTCANTQVRAGEGCWDVFMRCGITESLFKEYNGQNICNSLQANQHVCCSAGSLPDFSPQPNPDGTCVSYTVKADDTCYDIAIKNSMTVQQIEDRNHNTWGWAGCAGLKPDSNICLSTGGPPMPAPIANAQCGPQKPGTPRPGNMANLATLNPCPLNACCNVWGQCGYGNDFCVPSPDPGGAPGAVMPGSNGCISNCGMEITNNAAPPATFRRVGYWEGWNSQRPCLNMPAYKINTTAYTHIHFAFADITPDFTVSVSRLQSAYNDFKNLTGIKRILSFGGWTFSTDYDTAAIFREGVTAAQRNTFAQNVVDFIVSEGLDGVDFDWEYPGAPDMEGIPPASSSDGLNYLLFLAKVRQLLPKNLEIAIAAPASYWYLKGFPINMIAAFTDYIVYMTYDLHGQWDYGSPWASSGCPTGACLRSHTNRTETLSALAMITKAGVPAAKVLIGLPFYGRSFQLADPKCYRPGPTGCTFIGPESGAKPGRCTGEKGYLSNYEIKEIAATNPTARQYGDGEGGSVLVYDGDQWVSWMSEFNVRQRTEWVTGLNFGGTVVWAVDLEEDFGKGGNGTVTAGVVRRRRLR